MGKITGRCLCGSVSYSTKAEPAMIAVCHCTDCRRQSGGPFSVNVVVPTKAIAFEGDTRAQFVMSGKSGQPVTRNFCNRCGSPLTTEMPAFGHLAAIKAGTLDDSSWVKPTIQIWCDTTEPWSIVDDNIDSAPANPG